MLFKFQSTASHVQQEVEKPLFQNVMFGQGTRENWSPLVMADNACFLAHGKYISPSCLVNGSLKKNLEPRTKSSAAKLKNSILVGIMGIELPAFVEKG